MLHEHARKVNDTKIKTPFRDRSSPVYQVSLLALAGYAVKDPVFSQIPEMNHLSLAFWSRFIVTFDFPGQALYLKRGECYTRRDIWNRSGMREASRCLWHPIETVDEGSPAAVAGVQVGDIVLQVDDLKVGEATMFQISERLWKGSDRMPGQAMTPSTASR